MARKRKTKVYDKVKWHYPEGKGVPSLRAGMRHLVVIFHWLKKNNLLTEEARIMPPSKWGQDYSLISDDVLPEGQKLLDLYYDKWLDRLTSYRKKPSTLYLDKCLKKIRKSESTR